MKKLIALIVVVLVMIQSGVSVGQSVMGNRSLQLQQAEQGV